MTSVPDGILSRLFRNVPHPGFDHSSLRWLETNT